MKKISLKNYLIYIFICVVTISISLYIVLLYNRSKEYYMNNSVLLDVVSELVPEKNLSVDENMNNYLVENSNVIIYVASGKNTFIKNFEIEFKKFIINEKLTSNIMYINADKIKNSDFLEQLCDYYCNDMVNLDATSYKKKSIVLVFKESKIVQVYDSFSPNLYEMKLLLIKSGVIEND